MCVRTCAQFKWNIGHDYEDSRDGNDGRKYCDDGIRDDDNDGYDNDDDNWVEKEQDQAYYYYPIRCSDLYQNLLR